MFMKSKNTFWLQVHLEWLLLGFILLLGFLLRFVRIEESPPSLYWDEAAIAYDALAIANTGNDMHGQHWLQPVLYSYGDYKAPVYIWMAALSIKVFGPTVMAVRLPSVLAGTLLVLTSWLLCMLLFNSKKTALLAAFLTALSPWSIQFSRAAFEANIGALLLSLTVVLILLAKKNKVFFIAAAACGVGSIYSYFSLRLVLPLVLLGFLGAQFKNLKRKDLGFLAIAVVTAVLLLFPLFSSDSYKASNQFRLSNNNLLTTNQFVLEQNTARKLSGNTFISRLIYHRYWFFLKAFGENVLHHLDFNYLFISGDENRRHSTGFTGILLLGTFPFLVLGIWILYKEKPKLTVLLTWWWLVSLIPAALVFEVPHSLRTLNGLLVSIIFAAVGLGWYWHKVAFNRWLQLLPIILISIQSMIHFHDLLEHYPVRAAESWQDGYIQMAQSLKSREDDFNHIYVDSFDRYWLYHLFFQQIWPNQAQTFIANFGQGDLMGKYSFGKFRLDDEIANESSNLYVLSAVTFEELNIDQIEVVEIIRNTADVPVFYLLKRPTVYAIPL